MATIPKGQEKRDGWETKSHSVTTAACLNSVNVRVGLEGGTVDAGKGGMKV